jgi:peptidoglycan/LPS O-acetylase OafA/YrhL
MFFALSGFLVAMSLERSKSIVEFFYLRALRIMPALTLEVALSALVLGPLLTTLTLGAYFHNHLFFSYLDNIVGWIHFHLPGVFVHNPYPGVVNGSLWTVPFELECYLLLGVFAVLGLSRHRVLCLMAFFVVCAMVFIRSAPVAGPVQLMAISGKTLVLFFLAGFVLNQWRDVVAYSWKLAVAAFVLSVVLMNNKTLLYLTPLPIAYMTVYLGLMRPKKIPVVMAGDYSYGVYLYAFPIQQTVAATISHVWYIQMPVALVLIGLFAAFSWHCVEKPLQGYKRAFRNIRLPIRELRPWILTGSP